MLNNVNKYVQIAKVREKTQEKSSLMFRKRPTENSCGGYEPEIWHGSLSVRLRTRIIDGLHGMFLWNKSAPSKIISSHFANMKKESLAVGIVI